MASYTNNTTKTYNKLKTLIELNKLEKRIEKLEDVNNETELLTFTFTLKLDLLKKLLQKEQRRIRGRE